MKNKIFISSCLHEYISYAEDSDPTPKAVQDTYDMCRLYINVVLTSIIRYSASACVGTSHKSTSQIKEASQ